MIIWLASYPKSGNTWVRFFILSLLFGNKLKLNLNHLKTITQYPKKSQFNNLLKDYQNFDEITQNWIASQNIINLDKKIRFLKTHNMMCCFGNNCFTNSKNTLGSIYIVRDPRNVITSIKNHFSFESYDESKNFIFNEKQALIPKKYSKKEDYMLETIIGSWKTHYMSWKNSRKNYLLIKYENLLNNSESEFRKISKYISSIFKTNFSDKQIEKAITDSSFNNLKKMEDSAGFNESTINKITGKKNKFFNLGPKNDWKKILDKEISEEISYKFETEMKELEYL